MRIALDQAWWSALASVGLIGVAALMVLVSGFAILALIPGTVAAIVLALDGGGFMREDDSLLFWTLFLWLPIALCVAIHNAVEGLEAMNDPNIGALGKLIGLSILILLTFPPLWLFL